MIDWLIDWYWLMNYFVKNTVFSSIKRIFISYLCGYDSKVSNM